MCMYNLPAGGACTQLSCGSFFPFTFSIYFFQRWSMFMQNSTFLTFYCFKICEALIMASWRCLSRQTEGKCVSSVSWSKWEKTAVVKCQSYQCRNRMIFLVSCQLFHTSFCCCNYYFFKQNGGTVVESMDALFGLCRKKAAGRSVREPLNGTLMFADQKAVDTFVSSYRKRGDVDSVSYFIACMCLVYSHVLPVIIDLPSIEHSLGPKLSWKMWNVTQNRDRTSKRYHLPAHQD